MLSGNEHINFTFDKLVIKGKQHSNDVNGVRHLDFIM